MIGGVSAPADSVPRRSAAGRSASGRSAFTAGFLSLLFPGLGQVYGGDPVRGIVFAAPLVLLGALGAGLLLNAATRRTLVFSLLDTNVLLWLLGDRARLHADTLAAIEDPENVVAVSPVSSMRTTKSRYRLPRDSKWNSTSFSQSNSR